MCGRAGVILKMNSDAESDIVQIAFILSSYFIFIFWQVELEAGEQRWLQLSHVLYDVNIYLVMYDGSIQYGATNDMRKKRQIVDGKLQYII